MTNTKQDVDEAAMREALETECDALFQDALKAAPEDGSDNWETQSALMQLREKIRAALNPASDG